MIEDNVHDDDGGGEIKITLTKADWDYIRESDEQIARGECIDFETFAAGMRRKYGIEAV